MTLERPDSLDGENSENQSSESFSPSFVDFCSQHHDVFTAIRMIYRKYEHSLTNNFWYSWLPIAQVEWLRRQKLYVNSPHKNVYSFWDETDS
jgi:hypothetical protein